MIAEIGKYNISLDTTGGKAIKQKHRGIVRHTFIHNVLAAVPLCGLPSLFRHSDIHPTRPSYKLTIIHSSPLQRCANSRSKSAPGSSIIGLPGRWGPCCTIPKWLVAPFAGALSTTGLASISSREGTGRLSCLLGSAAAPLPSRRAPRTSARKECTSSAMSRFMPSTASSSSKEKSNG
jgi:hypothetical protein